MTLVGWFNNFNLIEEGEHSEEWNHFPLSNVCQTKANESEFAKFLVKEFIFTDGGTAGKTATMVPYIAKGP